MNKTSFITVHCIGKKDKIFETCINVESIQDFYKHERGTSMCGYGGVGYLVTESFETVKQMLSDFETVEIKSV